MMTLERLDEILKNLQHVMLLRDWKPWLDHETRADEGAWASVHRKDNYNDARIRVAPGFEEWTEWQATQLLAHELLHLHCRDLEQTFRTTIGTGHLHPDGQEFANVAWSRAEEEMVEQLSRAFANLLVPDDPDPTDLPGSKDADDQ